MRIIFHLDFDAFFVSAARTIDPSLINKPVAVAKHGHRSLISTSSYEARKLGVKAPVPLHIALKQAPNLIVIEPDFALYVLLSNKSFSHLAKTYTPLIESASIDECYLDVTDQWKRYGSIVKMAKVIQDDLLKTFKLPCSIGISNNKFVAKMATGINKPLGISVVKPGDFLTKCGAWEVIKFYGIGRATAQKLNALNIFTINDLAKADEYDLTKNFGILGKKMIWHANGNGDHKVDNNFLELKSIAHDLTFRDHDLSERHEILKILSSMTEVVVQRLKNRNLACNVVSIGLKVSGDKSIKVERKQKKLPQSEMRFSKIFAELTTLFDQVWQERSIKFISVQLTQLQSVFETKIQQSIFETQKVETKAKQVIKNINGKFNANVLMTAKDKQLKDKKKQSINRFAELDRVIKDFDVKD